MQSWLLSFSQLFAPTVSKASELEESQFSQMPIVALPGWAYARALALKGEGDDHASQVRQRRPYTSIRLTETRCRVRRL
jgi:hypothetical protein